MVAPRPSPARGQSRTFRFARGAFCFTIRPGGDRPGLAVPGRIDPALLDLTLSSRPACSMPGCDRPPVARLVASWSYGPLRERKNYGLACPDHRDALLALARDRRRSLLLGDDEQVGPVEAIPLPPVAVAPA